MKKVALAIASLAMISGVAIAHHGGPHQPQLTGKVDSGFRFTVATPNAKAKKASEDNCHYHAELNGTHCHS